MLHWTRTRTLRSAGHRRSSGSTLRAPCQLFALVSLAACSRSALEPFDVEAAPFEPDASVIDAGSDAAIDAGVIEPPPDGGVEPDAAPPPRCVPGVERCNGSDDDCNGRVDDVPPVACPGGGFRYCVGGRESACPERCESCIPGSERVCFVSYCTFWGVQTCAADGRGFGVCQEQRAPSACSRFATGRDDIDRLEQCCIDAGYCCVDEEDLDRDGDRREMLGRCDHVECR